MPNAHEPPPALPREREDPRARREANVTPAAPGADAAVQTPDEPLASKRSLPTPTRTIRDGEIQGHQREMPGDRDSQ